MDPNTLVEGEAEGLRAMAHAFRDEGFHVEAIYLLQRRSLEDDDLYWVVVLVMSSFGPTTSSDVIVSYLTLKQAGRLPVLAPEVRLEAVPTSHIEASRLLAYARRTGRAPLVLRNVGTEGLLIDYALIGEDRGRPAKAA